MIELTGGYGRNELGVFFISNMFVIMTIIFSVFIIILLINYKEIIQPLKKIKRKTWLILLVVLVIGFVLRNDSYFYGSGYDGYFYQETANHFFEKGIYVKGCAIGNSYDCKLYHQALFPAGFPYLIVLLYIVFGQHSILSMILSAFLGSFSIILVFLIAYLLFKKEEIGICSSIVFTLIPLEIMINGSAAVRPVSTFFMALSAVFFLIALQRSNVRTWSLFAITLSYTIYVRQENSILLIPFAILFASKNMDSIKSIKIKKISKKLKKYWLPVAIFLISQIPVQHWMLFGEVGWNGAKPIFLPLYFVHTAPAMFTLLFANHLWIKALFNPLTSILLLISAYFVLKEKTSFKILFLWAWFLVFFVLNSSYFLCQGYPQNNCISTIVRYMTTLSLPYSMLAGFVLFKIGKKIKINKIIFMSLSFILIFVISFTISGLSLPSTIFKDGRLDEYYVGDAISAINRTGRDCLLFVAQDSLPNSDMLDENIRRWVDIDLIMSGTEKRVWEEIKNSTCMIFIKDYRCREIADKQCEFIYKNFDMEFLFKENSVEAYRLELKQS